MKRRKKLTRKLDNLDYVSEPFGYLMGIPDYVKTEEETRDYLNKREYLKTFPNEGNKLYTLGAIEIILHLFPLEEAKAIINGKEINPDLVNENDKPFALLLKRAKKENMETLFELFESMTNYIFLDEKFNEKGRCLEFRY